MSMVTNFLTKMFSRTKRVTEQTPETFKCHLEHILEQQKYGMIL